MNIIAEVKGCIWEAYPIVSHPVEIIASENAMYFQQEIYKEIDPDQTQGPKLSKGVPQPGPQHFNISKQGGPPTPAGPGDHDPSQKYLVPTTEAKEGRSTPMSPAIDPEESVNNTRKELNSENESETLS